MADSAKPRKPSAANDVYAPASGGFDCGTESPAPNRNPFASPEAPFLLCIGLTAAVVVHSAAISIACRVPFGDAAGLGLAVVLLTAVVCGGAAPDTWSALLMNQREGADGPVLTALVLLAFAIGFGVELAVLAIKRGYDRLEPSGFGPSAFGKRGIVGAALAGNAITATLLPVGYWFLVRPKPGEQLPCDVLSVAGTVAIIALCLAATPIEGAVISRRLGLSRRAASGGALASGAVAAVVFCCVMGALHGIIVGDGGDVLAGLLRIGIAAFATGAVVKPILVRYLLGPRRVGVPVTAANLLASMAVVYGIWLVAAGWAAWTSASATWRIVT